MERVKSDERDRNRQAHTQRDPSVEREARPPSTGARAAAANHDLRRHAVGEGRAERSRERKASRRRDVRARDDMARDEKPERRRELGAVEGERLQVGGLEVTYEREVDEHGREAAGRERGCKEPGDEGGAHGRALDRAARPILALGRHVAVSTPFRYAADPVTYREPSTPHDDPDHEAVVIQELGRRVGRMRMAIIVPLLLAGIGLGGLLYELLAELQYAWRGAHMPWVTGIIAFAPTFGGIFKLAPYIADAAVRRRLPVWRRTLAAAHGLDLAQLEETTRLLE